MSTARQQAKFDRETQRDEDTILTMNDAAAFLGISRRTLSRLPIRYAKVGPQRRYLRRWLVEWLTARSE